MELLLSVPLILMLIIVLYKVWGDYGSRHLAYSLVKACVVIYALIAAGVLVVFNPNILWVVDIGAVIWVFARRTGGRGGDGPYHGRMVDGGDF